MTEETVTITVKEYKDLKESDRILSLLYAGGVDNWEWYSESVYGADEDEAEEDD